MITPGLQRVALLLCIGLAGIVFLYTWHTGDARAIQACKEGPKNFASVCYTRLIETTMKARSMSAALRMVVDISAVDSDFGRYCHSNMHDIGKAAYDSYRANGEIDVSPELSYCGYGFYHGFMEQMFAETGTLADAHTFCDALSARLSTNRDSAVSNCYHGIGHGVVDGSDPRVWGDPIAITAPGLELCAKISPNDELHRSCAMGAYNSTELMYADPKYKLDMSNGPFALCKEPYTNIEKEACYTEMSVLAVEKFADDYSGVFEAVHAVESQYRARAVRYVALYETGVHWEAEKVFANCAREFKEYTGDCAEGVAQGLFKYGKPEHEYDAAVAFCGSSMLSTEERRRCENIVVASGSYTADERKAACTHFPKDSQPEICARM